MRDIATARTFLFVPGDHPERFEKALLAGADAVILDLEDAVAPHETDRAREAAASWLDPAKPIILRINCAGTPWFDADVALCSHEGVVAVMVPKAEPGAQLNKVAALKPTLALLETARGIAGICAVASTPGVRRLAVGAIDLSLDLSVTAPETVLDPIFLNIVVGSRASGLAAPVAGVTTEFRDPAVPETDARRARSLGFGGKLCIHPAQIGPIHAGFRPFPAEVEHARRVVAADAGSGGSACTLDGQMIDRPVVDRARRILALAADGKH